ncbi:energy transducer TonB, partial [Crocosphaera sp. Alani8]|uniref:energy transducer TonB n=1 Tax=Crocosphaera sp. Alani8 TaxID=3038952 RepID=UPI00313B52C6
MASSYFKSAPLSIFNSNFISTFISVGLHGLALFLVVPYLSNLPASEPEVSDSSPINVPLIELNPSEQNRLPNPNSGLSTIPDFPNSSLGDLPMLDSPSLQSSLPNTFSNLPAPPALPPLPPLNSYNNYSRIPIALPPRRSFTPSPPPVPRSLPTPPPFPELKNPTPKTPPIPNSENSATPNSRQDIGFGDPNPNKPDHPLFQRPSNVNPLANNPRLPRNLNTTISRQDQIARRLLEDTEKAVNNLTYNPRGTTRREGNLKDAEWQRQTGVQLKPSQILRLRGTYPKSACNLKLEGTSVYNVLVNSDGQLTKPPFRTLSSGYGLLDNQAFQEVKSRSFPQSTRVQVRFRYDSKICGTSVAEGETNTQPQKNPPSPAPEAES